MEEWPEDVEDIRSKPLIQEKAFILIQSRKIANEDQTEALVSLFKEVKRAL